MVDKRVHRAGRRAAAIIVVSAVLGSGLLGSVAHAAPVELQSGELVVNGGAESGVNVGWSGPQGRASHVFGPKSVIVDSTGLTGATFEGGSYSWNGVAAVGINVSTMTQTVDLSPASAVIANGHTTAQLSAYVGGTGAKDDNATLVYDFRDGDGNILNTVTFGPVLAADRGSVTGYRFFSQDLLLPSGTVDVVMSATFVRIASIGNSDGLLDNISLVLDAPVPSTLADAVTTEPGEPVGMSPAANDAPGAGATLVPGTLRLLDGATPVTSLSTPEGDFVVDTATGGVTFTPAPGYLGTTPPVAYRISDTSGQSNTGTLTVTVAVAPPPPAPSDVLPTTGSDSIPLVVGGTLLVVTGLIALLSGFLRRPDRRDA